MKLNKNQILQQRRLNVIRDLSRCSEEKKEEKLDMILKELSFIKKELKRLEGE